MSDARRNRDPHKVRIKLSGGLEDLKDLESLIRDDRQECGWELNWYRLERRGDHGPLHDLELGFIESIN
jgi:hypothetical protein